MTGKKLTLSDDKMIGGVCGGIAEYFDIDATLVRIGYALLTFCTAFSGIIFYIILYIIIPSKYKIQ